MSSYRGLPIECDSYAFDQTIIKTTDDCNADLYVSSANPLKSTKSSERVLRITVITHRRFGNLFWTSAYIVVGLKPNLSAGLYGRATWFFFL